MTSSNPTFDFKPYLAAILSPPPGEIDVHILSGGYTNLTARATFSPPINLPTHFEFPKAISSVILKKATPYMHAFPSQVAPINRQAVEARALRMLQGTEPSVPEVQKVLTGLPTLKIPRLLFHDTEQNILWMTDLGRGKILTDYILSDLPSKSKLEELADALGRFTAALHSATKNTPPEVASSFSDPWIVLGYLASDATRIIRESLEWKRDPNGTQALLDLMHRVLDHESIVEPCLGMVDLWPGNTLISAHEELGLLDWEDFGLSDPGCELGLFVGRLHLCLLLGVAPVEISAAVRVFVAKLASSYFAVYPGAMSYPFKRRFLVTHGRELIVGTEMFARTFDAASKARAVEAGLQCLRALSSEDGTFDYDVLKILPPEIVEGMMLFLLPDI
ncbi:hypothetical protein FS837_008937 [Tulasnella sp. UAMH 9824]|nr:hypothetical protein FS837_008937 [Tulasnella sp. UAMH 9824]